MYEIQVTFLIISLEVTEVLLSIHSKQYLLNCEIELSSRLDKFMKE